MFVAHSFICRVTRFHGRRSHDGKLIVKNVIATKLYDGSNRHGITRHDGSNRHVSRLHDGSNRHAQSRIWSACCLQMVLYQIVNTNALRRFGAQRVCISFAYKPNTVTIIVGMAGLFHDNI